MPPLVVFEPDEVWIAYVDGDREDIALRDVLFERYYEMSCKIVSKLCSRLPSQVPVEDMLQFGAMGLLRSIPRFDPYTGVPFESFVIPSIRGAVLDGVRDMDWLSRGYRRKQRDITKTAERLAIELDRPATRQEIADALDVSVKDVADVQYATEAAKIRSLDEPHEEDPSRLRFEAVSSGGHDDDTREISIVYTRTVDWLQSTLTPQEQVVVALYYLEGLTLGEIGRVIGVSEAKASTIHSSAVCAIFEYMSSMLTESTVD